MRWVTESQLLCVPMVRTENDAAVSVWQSDSADAGRSGKVVAVADVDANQLKRAEGAFEGAKTYTDFRKMLDEMRRSDEQQAQHLLAGLTAAGH